MNTTSTVHLLILSLLQRPSKFIEPVSYFLTNYTMVETVREFDSYAAASVAACAWVNSGKTKVNTGSLQLYIGYVLTISRLLFPLLIVN